MSWQDHVDNPNHKPHLNGDSIWAVQDPTLNIMAPQRLTQLSENPSTTGSETPKSIRSYHIGGSGSLSGGGIQKLYGAPVPAEPYSLLSGKEDVREILVMTPPTTPKLGKRGGGTADTKRTRRWPWAKTDAQKRIEHRVKMEQFYTNEVDMKQYKKKLDGRLGLCMLACFITIAGILAIYAVIHHPLHEQLTSYTNRTHQIAVELDRRLTEEYGNLSKQELAKKKDQSKRWMSVEELQHDSDLIEETNSTVWSLFWCNVFAAICLIPVIVMVRSGMVQGSAVKIAYRVVILLGLLFCVWQLLNLLHPILAGAYQFPGMVERLFVEAYPRDEYQRRGIEDSFACQFETHAMLVQYQIQEPCVPKLKNSLFPVYTVLMLIFVDMFPFLFAAFTYCWSACIKNSKLFRDARTRVELNNQRRVAVPINQNHIYITKDNEVIENQGSTSHGQLI